MGRARAERRIVVQNESPADDSDPGAPPHERLLSVARTLFCRDGIHATGIDRILAQAGVSKMTLYSRFGSKEALVREVLRQEGSEWRAHFFTSVAAAGDTPQTRLAGIMAALAPWFGGDRFYGCAFMNAVAEHAKGEPWLRGLAAEHHQQIIGFLAALAGEAGYADTTTLARRILLVIDGAIAAFLVSGDPAVLDLTQHNLNAVLAGAERAG